LPQLRWTVKSLADGDKISSRYRIATPEYASICHVDSLFPTTTTTLSPKRHTEHSHRRDYPDNWQRFVAPRVKQLTFNPKLLTGLRIAD
jgi:hypothetical protein